MVIIYKFNFETLYDEASELTTKIGKVLEFIASDGSPFSGRIEMAEAVFEVIDKEDLINLSNGNDEQALMLLCFTIKCLYYGNLNELIFEVEFSCLKDYLINLRRLCKIELLYRKGVLDEYEVNLYRPYNPFVVQEKEGPKALPSPDTTDEFTRLNAML